MKKVKKIMLPILILLLICISVILLKAMSDKNMIQKEVDLSFVNDITDAMDGLSKDYSKLSASEKTYYYYKTVSNLHDARNIFYITSYKDHSKLYLVLDRLYIYLTKNYADSNDNEDKLYIHDFLGKVMSFPEDDELISEFETFLNNKNKE